MPQRREHDPDRELLQGIGDGDGRALSEFVRRNERWVRGVLFATLGQMDQADDVLQQVWLTLWRRAGQLQDPKRWRGWVYRLARSAALDAARRRGRWRRLMRQLRRQPNRSAPVRDAAAQAELTERHQQVLAAIAAMPERYRQPLVLRHLEELSYRQIAEILELPVETVETRLVRARRMLRERLSRDEKR